MRENSDESRNSFQVSRDSESAIHLQQKLAKRVGMTYDDSSTPRLVCGLDAAYSGNKGVSVAAVVDIASGKLIETAHSKMDNLVGYFPGLFAFREGPLLVEAASKLRSSPDVFIVEGHGLAHPRRFGIACHVGIALNKPTIGVARKLLYGTEREDFSIVDTDGTVLARVLNLRSGKRPLYVSVGHKTNLHSAVHRVLYSMLCSQDYPLPLRMAHQGAVMLRNRFFDP